MYVIQIYAVLQETHSSLLLRCRPGFDTCQIQWGFPRVLYVSLIFGKTNMFKIMRHHMSRPHSKKKPCLIITYM